MSPQRLQRSRVKGAHLPEGTICVDRTTRYGNPFTVAGLIRRNPALTAAEATALAVTSYRDWISAEDDDLPDVIVAASMREYDRLWIRSHLHELAGRDLACYCALPDPGQPDLCHAAVLIELAAELVAQ